MVKSGIAILESTCTKRHVAETSVTCVFLGELRLQLVHAIEFLRYVEGVVAVAFLGRSIWFWYAGRNEGVYRYATAPL